jgi:branched-subunit amino acid aminotransferase/4-amino-4-deoxychorismate lyase
VDLLKQQGITVPANTPPHVVNDLVRIVSLIWLDGRIVPREQFHIDPADEGLLFGRGLWESTRTFGGLPWLWPLHIERLLNTAKLLEIDVDPQRLPDAQQVHDYVRTLSGSDVVIRLNVTAGWPAMKKPGAVWMTAMLLPKLEPSVRLRSCSTPVPKDEPYLTWKTFQYAGRMRASQEAHKAGFDSALLCDAEDNVLEMSLANIFVRLPDGWATPTATGGLLPGTVRRHLLEKAPLPMRELTIPRRRLAEVTEVFITNSKVGILPVVQIDDQKWPIGAETQELMRWLLPASAAGNSGGPQDRR